MVERANARQVAGFTGWVAQLARLHTRELALVAAREGLAGDDALDAVQEAFATFLILPQARGLSEAPEEAMALLAVIVRNAGRNLRRRHHRARPHVDIPEALADDTPSVTELIERAEEHVAILGCVQQLGEIQRHVVTMRMLEEMSQSDVAHILGLAPGHVAVLLFRAKEELRRCLAS